MSPKTLPKMARPRPRPDDRPSYPTFFRLAILPGKVADMLRREMSTAVEQLRARADVARIDAASLDELIAMSGSVNGYGRLRLKERLIEEPEALIAALDPLLGRKYPRTVDLDTEGQLAFLLEPLAELGEPGGALLARHFEALPEMTQVLAAVVLGLTGQREMAPTLLDLAGRLRRAWTEEHVVGPLWGLVDLEAPGVEALLLDMLHQRQIVAEHYGFLARVGRGAALAALLAHLLDKVLNNESLERVGEEIRTAMAGAAHRIGPDESRALIEEVLVNQRKREERVQEIEAGIAARPPEYVRDFFEITFAGRAPDGAR